MRVLPYVSLTLWAAVLLFLAPSVGRLYRGPKVRRQADEWRGVVFFAACLFVSFNARRVVMPGDTNILVALYSISVSLPIFVLILLRQESA